jgi:DNA mismatch endonuclease (patch repair protein)
MTRNKIRRVSKEIRRDPSAISKIMAAVRSQGTEPELLLRKALRTLGHRLHSHPPNVPGRPDFVFSKKKVAIFVDGDFWHGRQWRLRGLQSLDLQFSKSPNRDYWIKKITSNMRRDRRTSRRLRELGWRVLRLWERDIKLRPQYCLRRIHRAIERANGQD